MLQFIWKYAPGIKVLFHYNKTWFATDFAAGLSVAAVALPVGIAYSALAGVPAVYGIYAAIFPLFAYAIFGSSKQLITGPDAATCIIVASSLAPLAAGDIERYQALMAILTLCTGLVYLIAGIVRLGFIANFLSFPILTGFLNGVAILIIVGQLQQLLGYSVASDHFFVMVFNIFDNINKTHLPTFAMGGGLLLLFVMIKKLSPKTPNALLIVVIAIGLVTLFDLGDKGIKLLGIVPSGLPAVIAMPDISFEEYKSLFLNALALMLVSFTSGILTAKSFAQKNKYEIDANQELIGFGACNLASGLAQGFPVTGADSRTAVCSAMGGKSQMTGIFAALAMLIILFFLTDPLQYLPITALAAVIIVSAGSLLDFNALKKLSQISSLEFALSIVTTVGVLVLGALQGVFLAIILSLLMLLAINSKPPHAVVGWVPELKGFHNIKDYPDAETLAGLLLFRYEANLLFFNIDYFVQSLKEEVLNQPEPVKWIVLDGSSINVIDVTTAQKLQALKEEFSQKGIVLNIANEKQSVKRFFNTEWKTTVNKDNASNRFASLKSACKAFKKSL